MNHSRRTRHSLSGRLSRAGVLIASAAPAVLWADPPLPPGWNKYLHLPAGLHSAVRLPPGWDKHLPLPGHSHPLATAGTPGWQLTLMAVTAVLLVAASVAIGYPGPGRTAAGARAHRSGDDRARRHAGTQRQPQSERPHPASRPGRDGSAGQFIQQIATATSVATRPVPARSAGDDAPAARDDRAAATAAHRPAGNPPHPEPGRVLGQPHQRPDSAAAMGLDQSRCHVIASDGYDSAGDSSER
jgi:hypothetical protein